MWFLIGIVMALLALIIYSFVSGGIVKRGMETIGIIHSHNDLSAKCYVLVPGTDGDTDGDGIKDIPECAPLKNAKNAKK